MIDTPDALEALVARALDAGVVAIDTEFVWERTYYPQLGVVQLGLSDDACFLIDAVALDDLSSLGPLLADPNVVKILHDPQLDLTILRRATGVFPKTIFDTQRAAGFVGCSATLSLGDLVQETLDIHLPKTQTRTDWLQRPLSDRQRAYALDDVRYLPAVREALLARAERRNRTAWIHEEMEAYDDPTLYEERDPREQHTRVSGAGRLSAQKRAVLRELAAWREREARRQDRPRGHVLKDKVLAALARRPPRSPKALTKIRRLNDGDARRYGTALLDAVARGLDVLPEDHPRRPRRPPQDDVFTAQVNLALAALTGQSHSEGIDPGLIGTRADVTALAAAGPNARPEDHPLLQGWRRTFIGDNLVALLSGDRAVRIDPATGLPNLVKDEN